MHLVYSMNGVRNSKLLVKLEKAHIQRYYNSNANKKIPSPHLRKRREENHEHGENDEQTSPLMKHDHSHDI